MRHVACLPMLPISQIFWTSTRMNTLPNCPDGASPSESADETQILSESSGQLLKSGKCFWYESSDTPRLISARWQSSIYVERFPTLRKSTCRSETRFSVVIHLCFMVIDHWNGSWIIDVWIRVTLTTDSKSSSLSELLPPVLEQASIVSHQTDNTVRVRVQPTQIDNLGALTIRLSRLLYQQLNQLKPAAEQSTANGGLALSLWWIEN